MNSTPAPPSTLCAAASIWSGVGDVNTWPGHAASSMPWPTKPACSGSWPEPPPEISATLPAFNWRRRTNWRCSPSDTMSACAPAKPSRLSASTLSTSLMSFFMIAPPAGVLERVAQRADDQRHRARTRIHVAERAFAEERRTPLDRVHRGGGLCAVERTLFDTRDQVATTLRQDLLHRVEHVEQGLLADIHPAQAAQRRNAAGQRLGRIGRRRLRGQLLGER